MQPNPALKEEFGPEPDFGAFGHEFLEINGLEMHVATLGTPSLDKPSLIFLHGFPDLWCGWARVMAKLCDSFFCVAPDQRGYNLTSRPGAVADYAPIHLLADVEALIQALSPDKPIVLIGHDWGGILASWFAALHPKKVQKLVLINTTHPALFQRTLWADSAQRAVSAYIDQLRSGKAEALWLRAGTNILFESRTAALRQTGAMSAAEADLYKSAWTSPDAWKAMIHWYRASPFELTDGPALDDWTAKADWQIACPTLLIWGDADPVFLPILRDGLHTYAHDLNVISLAGVGHNPVRECPMVVASHIRAFVETSAKAAN
jgi:epoxide hydrolase 4